MPMKCIAGVWNGRSVQFVPGPSGPRLEAVLPPRGGVATADTLALDEFDEPALLDRGVHLRFGRGLAFAAIPVVAALFLYDHPLFFTVMLALALAVFFEQSVVVRYVVEFRGRSGDLALVLEMERSEWIPLILATRGYGAATSTVEDQGETEAGGNGDRPAEDNDGTHAPTA